MDNGNGDFTLAVSEAIDLITSHDEFQDIMKTDPIGISDQAVVAEAGSKARGLNPKPHLFKNSLFQEVATIYWLLTGSSLFCFVCPTLKLLLSSREPLLKVKT